MLVEPSFTVIAAEVKVGTAFFIYTPIPPFWAVILAGPAVITVPPSATIPIWLLAVIFPLKLSAASLEYRYIPLSPTLIIEASWTSIIVPAPSAYTPIPFSPVVIDAVPAKVILEPAFAAIPIALLESLDLPTLIVPSIIEIVLAVAITPTLALPKATVPTFIFEIDVALSRSTPVLPAPVDVILFAVMPFVAPLIYIPIASFPVIVILSFLIDVVTPLYLEYIPIPLFPTFIFAAFSIFAISVYIATEGELVAFDFPATLIVPVFFTVTVPVGVVAPFVAARPIPPFWAVIVPEDATSWVVVVPESYVP